MFITIVKCFIISAYILSATITVSDCFTAKHNRYKEYVIEQHKVCSPVANREIDLKKDDAVLVTQTTTKSHTLDWTHNLLCKFSVESKTGLFAVVQNLNLRKNQTTGECIDYIQFATKKVTFHKRLCGVFNIADQDEINADFIAQDPYGYVETLIFIAKEKLVNEETDLRIVYTKYKKCDATYKSCEKDTYSSFCIHEDLFNDTLVNCPLNDCADEFGCANVRKRSQPCVGCESDSNSTKIILSAVTSLVLSFVVFVICIWVCKKTGKLCWGARRGEAPPARVIEMQNRVENAQAQPQHPAAPAPPDPEKDLPPSYDSLFPA